MERWVGRVAIVTGASAGIGAAIAKALAQNGMRVVGVARREERIQELADALKKENTKGELFPFKGDITIEEDVKRVVQWTRDTLGGADVLVNNAGRAVLTKLSEVSIEDMHKVFGLNVFALTQLTGCVIQDMKSRGVDDGHIFHINSTAGHSVLDIKGMDIYITSKHAVTVLTELQRRELRDSGTKIRITSISPGLVRTEIMVASGLCEENAAKVYSRSPCLESEDVANGLLYVLSTPPHVQIHELTMQPTGDPYNYN
ncbi:Hypothetical predicted protein [Cloeon dipterum]|uniref:Dehydrogenase n=1 Tax=Cloeon dipterum TaxID=197152 RepID=A0A8S1D067_9INSE|nr:Hypothetical predicted protein [Cloeon dipterum]